MHVFTGSVVASAGISSRTPWLIVCLLSVFAISSSAADPAWWSARGAVSGTPNPYAAANQGQLKQFTSNAVAEINADLTSVGGAGTALNNLVAGWANDYATNNYASTSNPTHPYKSTDFQVVNVGQLKYIASLLYVPLAQAGLTVPTWIVVNPSTDSDVANLGELKTVFNFSLTTTLDPDGSGLSVAWEEEYYGTTGVSASALAPGGSGLTNLQESQLNLNPLVASTMGDSYTDGWKVAHNLNAHHKIVADTAGTIVDLQVYTALQ
jgi:hypothetical protein